MKGFQPSRRGAASDCVEIVDCGCQEAADRVTGRCSAHLSRLTSPGLVIVDLSLPDVGLAAVALRAELTAAFAATDVTHRLLHPAATGNASGLQPGRLLWNNRPLMKRPEQMRPRR